MGIAEQVISAFQSEYKEQVAGIRSILASMDPHGAEGDQRWDEAFRMAHTLKGGARVCALHDVESLGHQMESLFAAVRDGSVDFDHDVADAIFHALDAIEDWMAALISGIEPPAGSATLGIAIEGLLHGHKADTGQAAAPATTRPLPEPPETEAPAQGPAPGPQQIDSVRVPTQHLNGMLRSTDALWSATCDLEATANELARLSVMIQGLQRTCESIRTAVAPELRRTGSAGDAAGIVRHVDFIAQAMQRIGRQQRVVRATHQRGAWATRVAVEQLRQAVIQTRMICADDVFHGLGPMVRGLARELGKQIEFRAVGLSTQADRMVLQALKDPLIHALRNAVVHGIETPRERTVVGKDPTGRIVLSLRAAGSRLHVRVEDDGRGVAVDKVLAEAVRQGLIVESEANAESARDHVRRLLFQPGFSTCSSVNELAGRGMGLSVVQETIARLRGEVRIEPGDGSGMVLDMAVPIVVSAERMLLVECAGQKFALPIHAVERLLRLSPSEIQTIDSREMTIVDNVPVPLISLAQALGCTGRSKQCADGLLRVVIMTGPQGRLGLRVDQFVTERDALIRELDDLAVQTGRFCGAIVLEDNEAALVVDLGRISDRHPEGGPVAQAPAPLEVPTRSVLVVDDSFTTRTLEKCILETNGYDVRVAVDGVEALNVLRTEAIDLVIADVQMPRMDGLTLLREIRGDARLASLPVILVTSLDRSEDRQRGLDGGANAYIVKRKFDHQDLLATIQRFL